MESEEQAVLRGSIDARFAYRYGLLRQGHRAEMEALEKKHKDELDLNKEAHQAALDEAGLKPLD